MRQTPTNKGEVLHFRCEPHVAEGLRKQAAKERRSLSNLLELWVSDRLKKCRKRATVTG